MIFRVFLLRLVSRKNRPKISRYLTLWYSSKLSTNKNIFLFNHGDLLFNSGFCFYQLIKKWCKFTSWENVEHKQGHMTTFPGHILNNIGKGMWQRFDCNILNNIHKGMWKSFGPKMLSDIDKGIWQCVGCNILSNKSKYIWQRFDCNFLSYIGKVIWKYFGCNILNEIHKGIWQVLVLAI